MRVDPIQNPLAGERVVGVWPTMRQDVLDAGWRRRLHLYTGRTLTAPALTREQDERAGHLTMRGQSVSPGVIYGLEAGLIAPDVTQQGWQLQLAPGTGLCGSGEDVLVPAGVRCSLHDVLRQSLNMPTPPTPPEGEAPQPDPLMALFASRPLTVGILRIEAATIDVFASANDEDPCEQDPSAYAFADETLVDAARVAFFPWPERIFPEPLPAPGPRLRNELAYRVFERELSLTVAELMPWEESGVAIGLVAFDAAGVPLFFDRSAVVRQGGKARRRTPLFVGAGSSLLWQARLRQLGEEVLAWRAQGETSVETAAHFRLLPPVGFLPTDALSDLRTGVSPFFLNYTVDARPVPLEQLDAVIVGSAGLAPFDRDAPEQVRVLVPVPEALYEPDLLKVEAVDAEFAATLATLRSQRNGARWHRDELQRKATALLKALNGSAYDPGFVDGDPPDPDPDALEKPERLADDKTDEISYGTADVQGALLVTAVQDLKTALADRPLSADEIAKLDELGLRAFAPFLDARVKSVNDGVDFGYLTAQSDIYRLRQNMLGETDASRLAVSPALATIAKGTTANAVREDLVAYFEKLKVPQPPAPLPPVAGRAAEAFSESASAQPAKTFRASLRSAAPNLSAQRLTLDPGGIKILDDSLRLDGPLARANILRPSVELIDSPIKPILKAEAAQKKNINDVLEQDFGAGNTFDFGNVTVGERLAVPPAQNAHDAAASNRDATVDTFKQIFGAHQVQGGGINLKGVPVFGKRRSGDPTNKKQITYDDDDPAAVDLVTLPANPGEADYFRVGVSRIENAISSLRAVETRIREYRTAIARVRVATAALQSSYDTLAVRAKSVDDDLAANRHAVATAHALFQDEQERVKSVNDRRTQILTDSVQFIGYHRVRMVDTFDAAPMRPLDPALVEQPVPACLAGHGSLPLELHAMVDLLREAPARFFAHVPAIFDGLDDLPVLHGAVSAAKSRAYASYAFAPSAVAATSGFYSETLSKALGAQQTLLRDYRLKTASVDLTAFVGLSWLESRERALDLVSLGDLADGKHGRASVARQAAAQLDDMSRVAGCVYARMSEVKPVLRLAWAEVLSQASGASLRDLATLPRWGELSFAERRELQILADWLYQRVDPHQPDALALMHDLVRVCILLASHAPVNQIVAGHVAVETKASVGGTIKVRFDPTQARVRVGMQATLYAADRTMVRAVVEDLQEGEGVARVVRAQTASFTIAQGVTVQFSEAARLPARLVV